MGGGKKKKNGRKREFATDPRSKRAREKIRRSGTPLTPTNFSKTPGEASWEVSWGSGRLLEASWAWKTRRFDDMAYFPFARIQVRASFVQVRLGLPLQDVLVKEDNSENVHGVLSQVTTSIGLF